MKITKIIVGLFFIYADIRWIYLIIKSSKSGPTPLIEYTPFILLLYGITLVSVALKKGKPYPTSHFAKIFCLIVSVAYIVMFIALVPLIVASNFQIYDLLLFSIFTIPVIVILLYDSYWIFRNVGRSNKLQNELIDD